MKNIIRGCLVVVGLVLAENAGINFFVGTRLEEELSVSACCYYPVAGQTDDTPNQTASGKFVDPATPLKHRWIAVSRDIKKRVKFGERVFVTGTGIYDGYWTVQDVMNRRYKRKIDFLIGERDFGRSWTGVKIIIVKNFFVVK